MVLTVGESVAPGHGVADEPLQAGPVDAGASGQLGQGVLVVSGHADADVAPGHGNAAGSRQDVLYAVRVGVRGAVAVLHLRHAVQSGQRGRARGLQEAEHGRQHRSAGARAGVARGVTVVVVGRRGEDWRAERCSARAAGREHGHASRSHWPATPLPSPPPPQLITQLPLPTVSSQLVINILRIVTSFYTVLSLLATSAPPPTTCPSSLSLSLALGTVML